MSTNKELCHVCKSEDLKPFPNPKGVSGVTSDCKVWSGLGTLAICNQCGVSQTITNEKWFRDVNRIYENYEIYHQGDACDHFIIKDGKSTRRSDVIVEELLQNQTVGKTGNLLEIGPGGGNLLKVWNTNLPEWNLYAADVNEKAKERIMALKGVRDFYTTKLNRIPHKFDAVVCVHSLEHIPAPWEYLIQLKEIVNHEGILLINVPNCKDNPFIISVADHCSHFLPNTLAKLVKASGFDILSVSTNCIAKELVLVARNDLKTQPDKNILNTPESCDMLSLHLHWLNDIASGLSKLPENAKLGCLGTSIAGTWLHAQLGDRLQFFVDEDTTRQGKKHLGLPILSPDQVDANAFVFLAFPHPIALKILSKFENHDFQCLLPPRVLSQ